MSADQMKKKEEHMEKPTSSSTAANVPSLAGKKPLSTKPIGPVFDAYDPNGDLFKLPPAFIAELKKWGFDARFISSVQLEAASGYHRQGWKPFKYADFKDESGQNVLSVDQALLGHGPEGLIRRKEMVLAVRPLTMSERHRKWLDAKNETLSSSHEKAAAEELREKGKRSRSGLKVFEGYEEN